MATIYRGSPSRFAFSQGHAHAHAHYNGAGAVDPATAAAAAAAAAAQLQMQLRYNAAYAAESSAIPLPATPPPPRNGAPTPPPGATLGLSAGKQLYGSTPKLPTTGYGTSSPLYLNPLAQKMYPPQPTEMLFVSPGLPTPIELSIYENKQPTGLLHVTIGNQTVEFLDGVANMPQKR